ncbi:MAG: BTAD domain-containing putative transcriptional regulator [Chloroflexus sp.]|uniref:BTAD domain-containing putative transcriptional regulator n=1 Tax=Chloroflexus sp. TaxID=1904827 RepID=UPI003D14FA3D
MAGAGYGKTGLLHLLAQHLPSVWLPLSSADQDVAYLSARLAPHLEDGRSLLLDDLHELEGAQEAITWLEQQIRARPGCWVLSGRHIPVVLQAALDNASPLVLDEDDLMLSPAETALWLAPAGYSEVEAQAWHAYTRGWPLAVAVLARLAAHFSVPREQLVGTLETYLHETLFARLWAEQPPGVRRLLQLSSVALRFNRALAEYLWRWAEEADAFQDAWTAIFARRLFVEPAEQPEQWRYHPLFRDFMRAQETQVETVARTVMTWAREQGDWDLAIEQALAEELWEDAAALLEVMPMQVIWHSGRVLTLRRWVLSLPRAVSHAHPMLLARLGIELCRVGAVAEGAKWIEESAALLEAREDPESLFRAWQTRSYLSFTTGRYTEAIARAQTVLSWVSHPKQRLEVLTRLGNAYACSGQLPAARLVYREAIRLAEAVGDQTYAVFMRDNLAANVLAPMGYLPQAAALLEQNRPFYDREARPANQAIHLEGWATLDIEIGDWERLQARLTTIDHLLSQVEAPAGSALFWLYAFKATLAIAQGAWETAEAHLTQAEAWHVNRPDRLLALAQLRAWLARRRGRPDEAVQVAEAALAQPWQEPLPRGLVALEREIALEEQAARAPLTLHPDLHALRQARAMPPLLRLRALLLCRCYRAGQMDAARRHLQALKAVLNRLPHLRPVLTDRDPELGHRAWRVALLLGDEEEAVPALGRISNVAGLTDLLHHADPAVRRRAAQALAATRRETAMPPLHAMLEQECDPGVRRALEEALAQLEAAPPPPLRVQFCGRFRVWRGEEEIPDHAWPRPAVVRLFQYFVLHRGQPLLRDRILEDLWPDQPPQRSKSLFRRLLSWMHQVLEPHMRPRGPFRYFSVAWEVYTFDPLGRVSVDVECFERVVREALQARDLPDLPPVPGELLEVLEAWQPPVSAALYEAWWLERAERWQQLYAQGCLYVAQAYLVRGALQHAVEWSDRAIVATPWLEETYQIKMRALARLGQRSQALAVYAAARRALAQELGILPSPLTEHLAERLRQGELI